MTRQCAWCECYLSIGTLENFITHGICDDCAEQIRHSMQHLTEEETPRPEGILTAAKATLEHVFPLR